MATLYSQCGEDEYAMLDELIDAYRDDMKELNAQITLLFASSDKPGKPALTHHGFIVAGQAKVNSYKDRVEGKGDATITLDKERWDRYTPTRKLALLHHELSHIAGPKTKGKVDALGRPALRTISGDFENDGFYQIIQIYGGDAPEKRWLDGVLEQCTQRRLSLGGVGRDDPATARAASKAEIDGALAPTGAKA